MLEAQTDLKPSNFLTVTNSGGELEANRTKMVSNMFILFRDGVMTDMAQRGLWEKKSLF